MPLLIATVKLDLQNHQAAPNTLVNQPTIGSGGLEIGGRL